MDRRSWIAVSCGISLAACGMSLAAPPATAPTTAPSELGARGDVTLEVSPAPAAGQYASIQAAIDAAPEGAVIRIAPGTYTEQVTIGKPVTLRGAGWDKTTIRIPNGRGKMFADAAAEAERSVREGKTDAAIREALQRLMKTYRLTGVAIENADGVTIEKLKVTAEVASLPEGAMPMPRALVSAEQSRVRIIGCAVVGGPGDGIGLGKGVAAEVRGTLVAGVWSSGITMTARQPRESAGQVTIADCDVRNCYYVGILGGWEGVTIERSRIGGTAWHGLRFAGGVRVVDNVISDNARCGIYADDGVPGALVQGNLFLRTGAGIACWGPITDRYVGNTFVENDSGVSAIGSAKPQVEANIFLRNKVAVQCSPSNGKRPTDALPGEPILSRNLFWENGALVQAPDLEAAKQANGLPQLRDVPLDPAKNNRLEAPKPLEEAQGEFKFGPPEGAAAPKWPAVESPWPLTDEEKAIIPGGRERAYQLWKRPKNDPA